MHVAAASGAPTLGLFGPSPVEQYAPWGRCTAVVQTATPREATVRPGLSPPHDRHADGQPVGRGGRGRRGPAVAAGGERSGMSSGRDRTGGGRPRRAIRSRGRCFPRWSSRATRRPSWPTACRAWALPTRSSSCSTAATTAPTRSPGGSPTGSSRARGSAKGSGATPASRRVAAIGSSRSTPTSGSARSLPPRSAPSSRARRRTGT